MGFGRQWPKDQRRGAGGAECQQPDEAGRVRSCHHARNLSGLAFGLIEPHDSNLLAALVASGSLTRTAQRVTQARDLRQHRISLADHGTCDVIPTGLRGSDQREAAG